jgi:hypothetical protein
MELYAILILCIAIVLLYIVIHVYHKDDKKKVSRILEDAEWFSFKVLCISAFIYVVSFVLDTNKCHVASVFKRLRQTPAMALSIVLSKPQSLVYNIFCKIPWIVPSPIGIRAVPWFVGAMILPIHLMFSLAKYVLPKTNIKNIKVIIAALQIGIVAVISFVLGKIDQKYTNIRWLTIGHDSWTTFEFFRKFLVLAAGVTAVFTLSYSTEEGKNKEMVSILRNAMTISVVTGVSFGFAFSFFNV